MAKRQSPYNEYQVLEQIGTGTFGTVHRAKHKVSHHIVAIKVMKRTQKGGGAASSTNLREYKTLKHMSPHPNVIQLHDSFSYEKDLYFVMEYMDQGNLYQLIKRRRETNCLLTTPEVRSIIRQILTALAHLHQQGIFHRDLKPENLLIGQNLVIKLADFGLARDTKSRPPYTEYVSTRWYRAPEVLLHATHYSCPIDMWAVGAIFAELVTLRPLFPGRSEIDQLYRICKVLGSPKPHTTASSGRGFVLKRRQRHSHPLATSASLSAIDALAKQDAVVEGEHTPAGQEWADGVRLARKIGFDFPPMTPQSLPNLIPHATPPMIDLLAKCLVFRPEDRITASEALQSHFMRELEDGTLTPLVMMDPPTPAPTKKTSGSILWAKGVASHPQGQGPVSWMGRDLKDALRLSKSKTIDRFQLKRPSLSSLRMRTQDDKQDSHKEKGFDLPSIPMLSPIQVGSNGEPTRTASLVQSRMV